MGRNSINTFLVAAYLFSHPTWAVPTAQPVCEKQHIKHPDESTGVLFNEDCSIAYVLPPQIGIAELKDLTRTTNLNLCPVLDKVSEVGKNTLDSAGLVSQKVNLMISDFDPLTEEIRSTKNELSLIKGYRDKAQNSLAEAQRKMNEFDSQLSDLKYEDKSSGGELKEEVREKITKLMAEKTNFQSTEYRVALHEFESIQAQYEEKIKLMSYQTRRYSESVRPLFDLLSDLSELNEKINNMYRDYSHLEGSTGQIILSTQWATLVQKYQRLNRNTKLQWEMMPIKKAYLWAYQKSDSAGETGIPALRWSRIPGATPLDITGIRTLENSQSSMTSSFELPFMTVFGNSMSGQISLSLAGACPYFRDPKILKRDVNTRELTAHLVANVTYTYEMQVRRSYEARYLMSQLLSRLESEEKRKGFFRSQHVHNLVEDNSPNDWFDIQFTSNASEFNYSPQEQAEIMREVKAEIIDRAIKKIGVLGSGNPTPPQLPFSMPNGMEITLPDLRKCPFYYCQAGTIILGALDAAIGGGEYIKNFKKTNNSWVTQSVNGYSMVDRSSTLTFKSR